MICNVTTSYMEALLGQVNAFRSVNGSRMIFDLGKQLVRCHPRDPMSMSITASNVTLCNGTLLMGGGDDWHAKKRTLRVESSGVILDGIINLGGWIGLYVTSGCSATMRNCEMHDVQWGVQVGSTAEEAQSSGASAGSSAGESATLVAHHVKITNYTCMGIRMEKGANVKLHDCFISGGVRFGAFPSPDLMYGIRITGPDSFLQAHKVVCTGSSLEPVGRIQCRSGGRANLGCCSVICTPLEMALTVRDKDSHVELWYCNFSEEPDSVKGGTFTNNELVSHFSLS